MAPFAQPGGSETRDETKKSLVTIRDSFIGGDSEDTGRTDDGKQVRLSQTTSRKRTTAYSGKITVIQGCEGNDTTINGREGGDGGKTTNLNDMGDTGHNNGAGERTGCGKFNVFCKGSRTSRKGRNNNDDSDKGGGRDKDNGNDGDDSSSTPTNNPESITIISPAPGPTSLFLVSGPTQAPTLSLPPDMSATEMEASLARVLPFTTSYTSQVTSSLELTLFTPVVSFLGLYSYFSFY